MKKVEKIAVFIGRFQPFHNGHVSVIDLALETCDRIIVIIGGANAPRTARNPFTFDERYKMIWDHYRDDRIIIEPSVNRLCNDTVWANDIRKTVRKHSTANDTIYLIGYSKDASSFYLNMFPEWESIEAPAYKNTTVGLFKCDTLDATAIRNRMYAVWDATWNWATEEVMPASTIQVIKCTPDSIMYPIMDENDFIEKYKSAWKAAPYAPTFVTVDAVVTLSGHVLMVERGAQPGKGLMALPGGFVNQTETVKDACVRELYEETKIDLPKSAIYGSIVNSSVFDSPYRSQRGRTITHAFHVGLDPKRPFPKIKGSDDAAKAQWVRLVDLRRDQIYEDHADIIEYFTGEYIN